MDSATLLSIAIALPLWALMTAYRKVRGRDGLGLGDVKLVAVAGAWLDWMTVAGVVEGAALSALAVYLLRGLIARRPRRAGIVMPFGAFLAPAIWIGWLAERLLF